MKTKGQHLLIDLVNLDRAVCLNAEAWIKAFVKSSENLGMEVISTHSHVFEPPKAPGMTAYVLLNSSHFSVHTYAEEGKAAIDLFACTDGDLMLAFTAIKGILGIREDNISMIKQVGRFNDG